MPKVIYSKPFLSYPAQLALLKSRGMSFTSDAQALHLLERIGYYRLSGYWYPLLADKEKHVFKPNVNFDTAFSLYKFDRELRKIMGAEIEKIEVAVRTKMAHELSVAFSPFWIEDRNLFSSEVNFQETLAKINEEYARSSEEFILSFKSKYSNPLPPSFIILEVTSFGTLSRLYRNLKSCKAKREIAKSFALPDVVFDTWLHSIVSARNVCAHHERLWNRKLRIQPLFPRRTQHPWLADKTVSNNRIYFVLSMIVYFLNTVNPNHTFKQKLESLFVNYPNVDRTAMGFPSGWRNEPLWRL